MSVYTVHAPSEARAEADKFVFLRDGFHFWALLLGPIWLAWHRLWLALIGYLLLAAALAVGLALLGVEENVRSLVFFLLAVLMGLEAASLRRWSYSRRRWRQIDFVVADDEEAAERRFFDRWAAGGPAPSSPPSRDLAMAPYQPRAESAASPGIIGLFPEPGGSR